MFMSPNRRASSIRFLKELTYIHRQCIYINISLGDWLLDREFFLSLLFLHKKYNTGGKTRIWSDEAIHPTAVYQFKAHVIQDSVLSPCIISKVKMVLIIAS